MVKNKRRKKHMKRERRKERYRHQPMDVGPLSKSIATELADVLEHFGYRGKAQARRSPHRSGYIGGWNWFVVGIEPDWLHEMTAAFSHGATSGWAGARDMKAVLGTLHDMTPNNEERLTVLDSLFRMKGVAGVVRSVIESWELAADLKWRSVVTESIDPAEAVRLAKSIASYISLGPLTYTMRIDSGVVTIIKQTNFLVLPKKNP